MANNKFKYDMRRAVHFDFHTVGGIDGLLKDFDPVDFAKTMKDANVKYINFTAMCNNGYCYYPTKVGIVYPGLERDIFGETIAACHAQGIGVTAYLNVGINFEAAKNHLHWSRIDGDGKVMVTYNNFVHDCDRKEGNFFTRTMCFNNPEYVDYVKAIVSEIVSYDIDGFFCDGFYPEVCYCPVCMQKMLAAGVDIGNPKAVLEFQNKSSHRFSDDIRGIVGEGKYVFYNNDKTPEVMMNTHAEIEALPAWVWIHYESFHQRAAYLRNIFKKRVYMTGRFQRDWGDFGGIRPRAALENDVYDAFLQGYDISFGDHLDPVRGVNKDMYKVIGDIYSYVEKVEDYTAGAEYVAELAVLTKDYEYLLEEKNKAVTRMLFELKYTFDFVNPSMDFSKYKLLIIPDDFNVDDELKIKLENYVANGGKLLTSGTAGLNQDKSDFALSCYSFVKFVELDKSKRAYFKLANGFGDYSADCNWAVYYYVKPDGEIGGTSIKMKNVSGEQTATYVSAYFGTLEKGLHGCHYTPPKAETEYAMAVCDGNVAHIAFEVFRNYGMHFLQAQKVLVAQLLEKLLPKKLLESEDIPTTAKISLTSKPEYDLLHVKVTYPEHRNFRAIIEEHNVMKKGKTIKVLGEYVKATCVPEGKELSVSFADGYTTIVLDEIVGYQMIKLDK